MPSLELAYGRDSIPFNYDSGRFEVLHSPAPSTSTVSDLGIASALDTPIDSAPLDDLITPGDSVLIVTSDATRATGSAQIMNVLVRRLIQTGVRQAEIAIIFATGIHRRVRGEEKVDLLTQFIAERIRTIDHDAWDNSQLVEVARSDDGMPVALNRALSEFSKVIITGGVSFHYFAGFTGGRKSICPGLASAKTIEATHMLAMDFQNGERRTGVGAGLLHGNAVSDACERVAAIIDPAFLVNTIVDSRGRIERVFAGHWQSAHERACEFYASSHSCRIQEQREVVIVSCGGFPYDINMIQAHKALDMAAQACVEGGTIILLAECPDGLGRADFLKWFDVNNSRALGQQLREGYEVNGQTAWALLSKTERFHVQLITALSDREVGRMRMTRCQTLSEALSTLLPNARGYIMPRGAALLPVLDKD